MENNVNRNANLPSRINANIIYPELSYKIMGLVFEVYNELGFGYQEKYYQRAFAELLKREKIKFSRELHIPIKFQNKIIGRYFIDFFIEDEIVIEFKVANDFYFKHFKQVYGYLKTQNLSLGILILFTQKGIKYKRLANSKNSRYSRKIDSR